MYFFHWLRSFVPRQNPIGFGAADFIEITWLVLLLAGTVAWRPWIAPAARRIAAKPWLAMLTLAVLPLALRMLLLPGHPVPVVHVYDEMSHTLVADTLSHFRLANPAHPLHQFFETFFVLQEPTYSSIYPLGQGGMMAIGRAIFGLPWAGVLISTALFCALTYWVLCAWVPATWALLGGLLAVIEFGPLCYWMNTYWGGALPAYAGCLIFGALPRLRNRGWRTRDAVILGMGLSIHWLVRPFETIFVCLGVALFFLPRISRPVWRTASIAALTAIPAILLTMVHDKRVTGEWFTLPEALSREQYGVPASLTFQRDPVPHRALTPEQQTEYQIQMAFKGVPKETLGSYFERLEFRIRTYRFFYLTPLYVVLPLFFLALTEWSWIWIVAMLGIFALGVNFFPAYQHHYFGAVTCLLVLVSVTGLRKLNGYVPEAARLVILFCVAHFAFWYGSHLLETPDITQALRPFETWTEINHRYPAERRVIVREQVDGIPGKLLIFVRYYRPHHPFEDEWVYNGADIDGSRVVWARDLGAENEKLIRYYPDRKVWVLEPEYQPPRLLKYEASPAPAAVRLDSASDSTAESELPSKSAPAKPSDIPKLRLLPVPEPK